MRKRKVFIFMSLLLAALTLSWGVDNSYAVKKDKLSKVGKIKKSKKVTHDQRKDAAARAFQQGLLNPLMVAPQAALIDGTPHYFSHPNYANSQLPEIWGDLTFFGNPLVDREPVLQRQSATTPSSWSSRPRCRMV